MSLQGAGPHSGSWGDGQPYSDIAIGAIYSRILQICIASGLGIADSEDVAQDIWEWLVRVGCPALALTAPWLGAVVHNHILRHRRKAARQRAREGVRLEAVPEPDSLLDTSGLEKNEVLDRIAAVLPKVERNLLTLIRRGHTLARAAELLGIPRGSRAYYGGRLVTLARKGIQARAVEARTVPTRD
jgi:DNA-directed RNA polymerase specialized sigma24 family protein